MIANIIRKGTKVVLEIDTGLKIEKPIISFDCECREEYVAEMLKVHFWNLLKKFKHEIAKNPNWYLEDEEISKLKLRLVRGWNGSKHCWKRLEIERY